MVEIYSAGDCEKLLKDARNGDAAAQNDVATLYEWGHKVDNVEVFPVDKQQAFAGYKKACEQKNIDAMRRMADFLSDGELCEKNVALAKTLYQQAIEKGNGSAAINLAIVYRDEGAFEKAFELYEVSQKLDETDLIQLAYCHYYGIGTVKNKLEAFAIFQKIAESTSNTLNCGYDVDEANYYLGLCHLEGEIVEKSVEKARHFLETANVDNDYRGADELLLIIGRSVKRKA